MNAAELLTEPCEHGAVIGLLQELAMRDVIIKLDGDRLCVDAPRGIITPELRERLARHKPEILHLLCSTRIETILCPSDDCAHKLVLMNGQGYCPNHQMAITVLDNMMH